MSFTTLISTQVANDHLADDGWVVVDCRFSLADPDAGRGQYEQSHIPGAVYAHLNNDLSGTIIPGKTGRHPLPPLDRAADTFGELGIGKGIQVIAYDESGGPFAARLWWMLRWLGHDTVAVLDGGWSKWMAENRPTASGVEQNAKRDFTPDPNHDLVVDADFVARHRTDPQFKLIDARAPERFAGRTEPIDPVAGRIPGAVNAFYRDNLDQAGCFLPADQLKQRFEPVIGTVKPENVILYCGSGVSATHNALAMAHAGIPGSRLYAGSWSDWITDPDRPIAKD